MKDVAEEIGRARAAIETGRFLLSGGFEAAAARDADVTPYHADKALIVSRTGKGPQTRKGLHTEFARVSLSEPTTDQSVVASLSRRYRFRAFREYGDGTSITLDLAKMPIGVSCQLLESVAALVMSAPA